MKVLCNQSRSFLTTVDKLFCDKYELYLSNPKMFFADINEFFPSEVRSSLKSLHNGPVSPGQLVRARCMIQDVRGAEFFPLLCDIREGEETWKETGLMKDTFERGELVGSSELGTRQCYMMVEVPGASRWYLNEFHGENSAEDVTENGISEKRARLKCEKTTKVSFTAKFFGDSYDELKPNMVLDVYGLLSDHSLISEDEHLAISTEPELTVNVFHYDIVDSEVQLLETDDILTIMTVLRQKLLVLMGDDISTEILMNFLVSTTYGNPQNMDICNMTLNIVGVNDSRRITDLITSLMPKVHVLTLTPSSLSDLNFAPVKDYNRDCLRQGELQLSNGTVLIIDETSLPEGSFPVHGFAENNLKVLEQLIVEQRMLYDYGFYKIPFDVDISILVFSKAESRFFKTPFRVPILPLLSNVSDLANLCSEEELKLVRQCIQQCRNLVKTLGMSEDVSKLIQEDFVNMCPHLEKNTDKASLLSGLLIISRMIAACSGCPEVQFNNWKQAVQLQSAMVERMAEWKAMYKTANS